MKTAANLQDIFLNRVRKEHTPVTVFLVNGYQARGTVKGFDNYILVLDSDGKQQMIYKHAISTISPLVPVKFNEEDVDD
ncbi:MAG: RNA chaperone Hfq [Clostridia bacterium]|nr:RNA chaperone Hfq [Clostridia bacterium]